MQLQFEAHGISINALPPFQSSLDCPHLNMTKTKENKVIITDVIKLDNERTWISPITSLGRKMAHNKRYFLHTSENGFVIRPPLYEHTSITCVVQSDRVAANLFTSVTYWGRQIYTPLEEQMWQFYHHGVQFEERYVCHYYYLCDQRKRPSPL